MRRPSLLLVVTLLSLCPAVAKQSPPPLKITGYQAGEFQEPPKSILQQINGKETIRLKSLLYPGKSIEVPVRELKLVAPKAKQTNFGRLVGAIALKDGIRGLPNKRYFSHPRIACAAFVSSVFRRAGRPGYSFAVNTFYAQERKHHGVLIASRVSTKYAPWYQWYKSGDEIYYYYNGGSRFAHMEVYVGGGKSSGTSSSKLHLAVRPIGNRGFRLMNVVRP